MPQWILATAGLVLASLAMAAEYSVDPRLHIVTEHNDNLRMTERNQLSAHGTSAEAGVLLRRRSEVDGQELDLRLRSTQYNRSDFDSDDQFARGALHRNWRRGGALLRFNVDRDSTRDSEIIDTGDILHKSYRRERYQIEPSAHYILSLRQRIDASLSAEAVRYGHERYMDYDYGTGSLTWTWSSSERLNWFVQGSYTHYKSKQSRDLGFSVLNTPPLLPLLPLLPFEEFSQSYSSRSRTAGLQLGGEYRWSEQLSLTAMAGQSRTRNRYRIKDPMEVCSFFEQQGLPELYQGLIGLCGMEDSRGNTRLWNVTLDWTGQRHSFQGGFLSQTQPSADGYLLESRRATLGWRYELTERARLIADGLWGRNKAQGSSPLQLGAHRSERDYVTARVRYQHKLTEHWFVEADYRYRYMDRRAVRGTAESSALMLGIRYTPQGWRWSR